MTNDTQLSHKDIIILLAISFEFATLIAKLAGRVNRKDGFLNEEEENNAGSNCVNLQCMVATILDASHSDLSEALRLTQAGRIIDELSNHSQATA